MTYGTVYEIPEDIGEFDICTFGSVLLHLRDPFLALQRVLAHVKETAVVTDLVPSSTLFGLLADSTLIEFMPKASKCSPTETYWNLSPKVVSEFLQILGFENTKISFHNQLFGPNKKETQLYTVVGQREGVKIPQHDSHDEESSFAFSEKYDRSTIKEIYLDKMRFSHIAKYLLRRSIRKILKKY